jgi:hypothetical protein
MARKMLFVVGVNLRAEINAHVPKKQQSAWLRRLIVEALRRETGRSDIIDDTPRPGSRRSTSLPQ